MDGCAAGSGLPPPAEARVQELNYGLMARARARLDNPSGHDRQLTAWGARRDETNPIASYEVAGSFAIEKVPRPVAVPANCPSFHFRTTTPDKRIFRRNLHASLERSHH